MTATERLRAMLDERGVEWRAADYNPRNVTEFKVGGIQFRYIESSEYDDFCWIDTGTLTPEQAIEATLGRGECHDTGNYVSAFECDTCGEVYEMYRTPSFCPSCGRAVRA